jgi:hypothetical protein
MVADQGWPRNKLVLRRLLCILFRPDPRALRRSCGCRRLLQLCCRVLRPTAPTTCGVYLAVPDRGVRRSLRYVQRVFGQELEHTDEHEVAPLELFFAESCVGCSSLLRSGGRGPATRG